MKKEFDEVCSKIGVLGKVLMTIPDKLKDEANEIRLNIGCKPIIHTRGRNLSIETDIKVSADALNSTFEAICRHSVYSYQREIAQGFITLEGGHRVGICGTGVYEGNEITYIKDISSLVIRIAVYHHCENALLNTIYKNNPCGILIAGPPMCGKTTLLRDMAISFSHCGYCVTVIDERNEICACRNAVAQYRDVLGCNIISGCKKTDAITRAIRSLSPDVIICDEMGSRDEIELLYDCVNCGVPIIATVHARKPDELIIRDNILKMLKTYAFKKIILMSDKMQPGKIMKILNTEEMLIESGGDDTYNSSFNDSWYGAAIRYCQKAEIS